MFPVRDNQTSRHVPYVTMALIGLNVLIFLWDRNGNPFGQSIKFADLGMRPVEIKQILRGNGDSFQIVTVFTSLFLHGNLIHLLGNMLYLLTFGPAVEWALKSQRHAFYYLFWGIAACATHTFVDPNADLPLIGASGAIGGVLGCYFLLFPGNKIEIIVPFVPVPIEMSAWILLSIWFLFQVFFRVEGVANWAHAGGFMAGMLTVLLLGGRKGVLKGRDPDTEDYELV